MPRRIGAGTSRRGATGLDQALGVRAVGDRRGDAFDDGVANGSCDGGQVPLGTCTNPADESVVGAVEIGTWAYFIQIHNYPPKMYSKFSTHFSTQSSRRNVHLLRDIFPFRTCGNNIPEHDIIFSQPTRL